MSTLEYWLWLTDRARGSAIQVSRLLERFGTPEQVYCADAAAYERIQTLSPQVRAGLEDKSLKQSMEILERCARLDIGLLTAQDAGYPDCLRGIHDPPLVLYYKGRLPDVDRLLTVGVVGSRQCTQYGATMAARLGLELARAGAVVVSGTAKGIDTSALRGALSAGGTVISVLGGGIDVPYPMGNGPLYQDVAAAGALISEYPPGTPNKAAHFPVRNRILSGLCDGVAAVEAGEKSGAAITVDLALEQNRDTFALPGPADAPMSVGTNRMIRMGWARLITGAADILEEYQGRRPISRPPPLGEQEEEMLAHTLSLPERRTPEAKKMVDKEENREYIDWKSARQTFTDDEMDILRALEQGEQTAQQLVELIQLPARRVLSAITVLQMRGYVDQGDGGRLRAKAVIRPAPEQ
ncbi:MAG: DNA-processing protein DprA [Oscillospiraceae bacterium]|nr:DNA-processing protein DprA [Oscillospiraceae bacterium]